MTIEEAVEQFFHRHDEHLFLEGIEYVAFSKSVSEHDRLALIQKMIERWNDND